MENASKPTASATRTCSIKVGINDALGFSIETWGLSCRQNFIMDVKPGKILVLGRHRQFTCTADRRIHSSLTPASHCRPRNRADCSMLLTACLCRANRVLL